MGFAQPRVHCTHVVAIAPKIKPPAGVPKVEFPKAALKQQLARDQQERQHQVGKQQT